MNYKKLLLIIFTSSLLVSSFSLFACQNDCIGLVNYLDRDILWGILASLLILALPLMLISLILYFCSETVFKSWFKFAKIYIPIAIIIALITSFDSGGSNWGPSGPDGIAITWLTSILFLIISLVIIIVKSLKKPTPQA